VSLLRAVVTVIGQDKIGIIAAVSQKLAELNINIVDVSQTIMQGNFTMMMMVSVPDKSDFDGIRSALQTTGTTLGVQIRIQREDIFTAMHDI
jgi:ACT domain-containing protein